MADPREVQKTLDRLVREVFDEHLPEIRLEITQRIREELEPLLKPQESPTAVLDGVLSSIQEAGAQSEVLRALLDGAAKFSGRSALFVRKGTKLAGWEGRGFGEQELKNFNLDVEKGITARALQGRGAVAAAAKEFDHDFIKSVGAPADGNALVLPLVVKDKAAALLYADAGNDKGLLDNAALQLLVRTTGLWLELLAARKLGAAAGVGEKSPAESMIAPGERVTESVTTLTAASAPAAERAAREPVIRAEEQDVHRKAKRFAKLLVDEIKLYNQSEVTLGKKSRDLYQRLKDTIEKSRAAYDHRYGNTPAAGGDYFTKELIRVLADNDVSLLGEHFPQVQM